MKKFLPYVYSLVFNIFFVSNALQAQTTVSSTDGYNVLIAVQPVAIVPTSSSCVWGYNYNVKLNYSVVFTGTNKPAGLYTLQGTLGCGSSSHFFQLPTNGGSGNVTSQSNVWNPNHDCATSTVISLGCNVVNIEIEGPGISHRVVSFTIASAPLPVTLINFNAEALTEKVKLSWSTATEINNDFFTVERSTDGTNWIAAKTIKGAGNSSFLRNYECYDESPFKGTVYYRLKQTDIDGKTTYSKISSVKFTGNSSIDIYPVPNTGNTIYFKGITEAKNMILTVRDAAGASLYKTTLTNPAYAELPSLKPGLYVITFMNTVTNQSTNMRYIKL